jgi:hypothetical protein
MIKDDGARPQLKIAIELEEWGRIASELGPGTNWHEPDECGIMARFDGTDGDLDNAGFWPMDVSKAQLSAGLVRGYDHGPEGAPRRGEMAIVFSYDTYEQGKRYRGADIAAVNVASVLGWAAEAAALKEQVAQLEQRVAQLKDANEALRTRPIFRESESTITQTEETYIRLRRS